MSQTPADITLLLHAAASGDRRDVDALIAAIYQDMRRLAAGHLHHERANHTLQPTALVHEGYWRLMKDKPGRGQNRALLCGFGAHSLGQILIERARAGGAAGRRVERPASAPN